MEFWPTYINGAYLVKLSPYQDERGVFTRLYCEREMSSIGFNKPLVQINHSLNKEKGTVRGMHFQYPPDAEKKMIRCVRGKVFDVLVDLRAGSPTFLQYYGVELSPDGYDMICIPEGCAHGFQTMVENSELLYLHSAFYNPSSEGAVRFNDPKLGIQWPLPITKVSEKDNNYAFLDDHFQGILPSN